MSRSITTGLNGRTARHRPHRGLTLVELTVALCARALQLRVVAEGVETQRQADLLTNLGCDELQGFLYAPALEPAAFAAFFAQPLRTPVEQPA